MHSQLQRAASQAATIALVVSFPAFSFGGRSTSSVRHFSRLMIVAPSWRLGHQTCRRWIRNYRSGISRERQPGSMEEVRAAPRELDHDATVECTAWD